ncbi:MAG: hypothetical protein KDD50_15735, partial [Bdellovibrionales bacterium]|nr:hypothetical protein [Bdellovibrionales bacterium]
MTSISPGCFLVTALTWKKPVSLSSNMFHCLITLYSLWFNFLTMTMTMALTLTLTMTLTLTLT